MRNPDEQRLALECLRLASGNTQDAEAMLAFVTGRDADDSKARPEIMRADQAMRSYASRTAISLGLPVEEPESLIATSHP